ncbi:MAG: hypothetical protein ACTTJV_02345 [Ottowia sp.]
MTRPDRPSPDEPEPERPLGERLTYAAIAAFFGALLGVALWWLYGLGFSHTLRYRALAPAAFWHWVLGMSGGMAALGFVLCERAADWLGHLLTALFRFEDFSLPERMSGFWWSLLAILGWIALLWITAPYRW